jgi:rRNA maturation protein Nop10
MSAVLDQLRSEGHNVADGDVVHLSPARYAHINPYGKYRFNVEGEFNRKGLRPLRQPLQRRLKEERIGTMLGTIKAVLSVRTLISKR